MIKLHANAFGKMTRESIEEDVRQNLVADKKLRQESKEVGKETTGGTTS
jgi:hypothetical protein